MSRVRRGLLVVLLLAGCHHDAVVQPPDAAVEIDAYALSCARVPADDEACHAQYPLLVAKGYACADPALSCFLGNGRVCCEPRH